ncbi:Clan SB, family S8, subtilisin-like serine peptidase [Histomonas meleagridis]|uniref:Clan SB, family S8, subtilisin-like serine peptidase n=1 Tax=Histomonas meleagridis TaxID=135588 RepID=UPI0035599BCA|nr:Clan SB, family S8, subtilisin-like serine peptidase [Histomonas meleagridis]KAH0799395.1 Clan SB, family S8, subtilisin-like serine peptidase [Histomonas meleagridis]
MFLFFSLFLRWWLNNTGEYAGIPGEDINYPSPTSTLYRNGTGIVINVIANGANYYHHVYQGRAIEDEFLETYNNLVELIPKFPENDTLGQRTLSLAAGSYDYCDSDGVAPGAKVASYNFYNVQGRNVSLEYTLCHHVENWHIGVIQYIYSHCEGRVCKYIPTNEIPSDYADECLYNPEDGLSSNQKFFVVPAGTITTDVFFTPPTRWPMVFSISAVNNRGDPLNRGAEGAGLFMSCPGARNSDDSPIAPIYTAHPRSETACFNTTFYDTYASASIFAGGLACILERKPEISVTDMMYITAMTACKVNPGSTLWRTNSFGLHHNRRTGFGRLDLSEALKAIDTLESLNYSFGKPFYIYETTKNININIQLKEEPVNITIPINITDVKDPRILSFVLNLNMKDLGFGSLIVSMYSPNDNYQTEYQLKILTEWSDLNVDITHLELPSYQFLGEKANGEWIVMFPKIDSGARGLLVNAYLKVFYSDGTPDPSIISQKEGSDPYQAIVNPDDPFHFNETQLVMHACENFTTGITVKSNYTKKCPITLYISDRETRLSHRVKVPGYANKYNTSLTIPFVPSVFLNDSKLSLIVESLPCNLQQRINVTYINDEPKNRMWLKDYEDNMIPSNESILTLRWIIHMNDVIDDGYSTSVCISIISLSSNKVIRRVFDRNIGEATFSIEEAGKPPSNMQFKLEISPSSSHVGKTFDPMYIIVGVREEKGPYEPYKSPYTVFVHFAIYFLFAVMILSVVIPLFRILKKKRNEEEEKLIEGSHV